MELRDDPAKHPENHRLLCAGRRHHGDFGIPVLLRDTDQPEIRLSAVPGELLAA
ncbi:hypothetical protein D3C86_1868590 [compost metagenome]